MFPTSQEFIHRSSFTGAGLETQWGLHFRHIARSIGVYKVKHPKGHSFSYLHCWYLLRNVPRWAEGSFTECRRLPIIVGSVGTQTQMAHASDLESDCVEVDVEMTQPSLRIRSRPQENRAAKMDHKNMK
jgi:hypothetical protein